MGQSANSQRFDGREGEGWGPRVLLEHAPRPLCTLLSTTRTLGAQLMGGWRLGDGLWGTGARFRSGLAGFRGLGPHRSE